MTSLRAVAWGLILVLGDFRIVELDLLPDPIGWTLVVVGLLGVRRLHHAFVVGAVFGVLGGLASLPDVLTPGNAVLGSLSGLALLGVIVATCTALMALVPTRRDAAGQIRVLSVVVSLAVLALDLMAPAGGAPAAFAVLVVVGGLAVLVWFLVLLFSCARMEPLPAA